jgi:alkaline phosphatase
LELAPAGSWAAPNVPVITTATGVGAEAFAGYYDNTAFFDTFTRALGLSKAVATR